MDLEMQDFSNKDDDDDEDDEDEDEEEENKDDESGMQEEEDLEEEYEDNILKGTNTKKERIKRNFGNCWVFCFQNGEPLFTIGPHCNIFPTHK